jgi:uncharacterized membrane protein YbhN (UPF0104 family)
MRRRTAWRLGALLVGAVVLAFCLRYVLTSFRWGEVLRIVKHANLLWLLGAGSASILAYWSLRALRWFAILRNLGTRVRFGELYVCCAASLGIATVTPFQSGEMLKIELLKRHGAFERTAGYGAFAVERVLDLLTVVSAAAVCVLAEVSTDLSRTAALLVLVVLAAVVLAMVLAVSRLKPGGKPGEFLRNVAASLRGWPTATAAVILTAAAWSLVVVGWQVSLHSIGVDVGFFRVLTLMTVVTLAAILSFIPGGLGVSEAGSAQILMKLGQPAAAAQAGAILIRSYGMLVVLLGLAHLVVWLVMRSRNVPSSSGTSLE